MATYNYQDPGTTAQDIANQSDPTKTFNRNTFDALISGQSGLSSSTMNTLLGFNSDIQRSQQMSSTDLVDANFMQANATEAGYASQEELIAAQAQSDSAAGYLLQQQGYLKEEGAYTTAAGISAENAALAKASGDVELYQQGVGISKTLGTQRSAVASSGFGAGGSALDVYASSMRAGNLDLSMTNLQTGIKVSAYKEQAQASLAEAEAVGVAATGAGIAATQATAASQEDILASKSYDTAQAADQYAANIDLQNAQQAAAAGTAAQTNEQNLIDAIRSGLGTNSSGTAGGGGKNRIPLQGEVGSPYLAQGQIGGNSGVFFNLKVKG
jgi:hypothetical protein